MKHAAKRALAAAMIGGMVVGSGCASGGGALGMEATVEMAAVGSYAAAFDAAKDVLREHRFELDRVDAQGGVITTKASTAGGWMTPWKDHASDWDGAWRDTVQDEARVARVDFSMVEDGGSGGEVGVVVERVRVTRFGRRVDPTSPRRFQRTSSDPYHAGIEVESVGRDPELEGRLLGAILRRVGGSADASLADGAGLVGP